MIDPRTPRVYITSPIWNDAQHSGAIMLPEATSYRRRRSRIRGDLEALYETYLDPNLAATYMKTMLGRGFREDLHLGFVGYVGEVTMNYAGTNASTSYEGLTTSVRGRVRELVKNGDFESGDFTNWTKAGDCAIDATSQMRGTYSVKFNYSTVSGYVAQTMTVRPNETYRLSFYYMNEGAKLYYYVYDGTNAAYIITNRLVVDALDDYNTRFEVDFITPAGCNSVTIRFITYNAGNVWLDDVSLQRINRSEAADSFSDPQENNIDIYGEIETIIDVEGASITTATAQALAHVTENSVAKRNSSFTNYQSHPGDLAKLTIRAIGYSDTLEWDILQEGGLGVALAAAALVSQLSGKLNHIQLLADTGATLTQFLEARDGDTTAAQALDRIMPANSRFSRRTPNKDYAYVIEDIPIEDKIYRSKGNYFKNPACTSPVDPWQLPSAFYIVDLDFPETSDELNKHLVERYEATEVGELVPLE